MKTFYGTCAPGLEILAARRASACVPGFSALKTPLSGAVAFTCRGDMPACGALHNIYRVVARLRDAASPAEAGRGFLDDKRAMHDLSELIALYEFSTFRVVLSDENKLAPMDAGVRDRFERAVRGAESRRAGPETEIMVLRRREGMSYLLLRLTHPGRGAKFLPAGALRGDVCQALLTLCAPEPGGTFLSALPGGGALCAARREMGSACRVVSESGDPLAPISALGKGEATEVALDVRPKMPAESSLDPQTFLSLQLQRLASACAPYARVAVLTGFKSAMEAAASENERFELRERHDCLIGGAKLAAFGLRRLPDDAGDAEPQDEDASPDVMPDHG